GSLDDFIGECNSQPGYGLCVRWQGESNLHGHGVSFSVEPFPLLNRPFSQFVLCVRPYLQYFPGLLLSADTFPENSIAVRISGNARGMRCLPTQVPYSASLFRFNRANREIQLLCSPKSILARNDNNRRR